MSEFASHKPGNSLSFARLFAGFAVVLFFGAGTNAAHAADVKIVALGASNTYGYGVSRSEAYPSHLQRLLRAHGINARVINAGVSGNTTGDMLARLDGAVPIGTRLVILQPGGNDRRKGTEAARSGNIAAIQSRLAKRKIATIVLDSQLLGSIHKSPPNVQSDGVHLTAKGYAALAASLLADVVQALGR